VLIILAMIPYTGWLLGYFVSARMIFRVSWFAPLGIGLVIIGKTVLGFIQTRIIPKIRPLGWSEKIEKSAYSRIYLWGLAFILLFGLGSPTMVEVIRSAPNLLSTLNFHRQLGQVGAYISRNSSEKVTVITLNATDNYLPGISANAKPISFREESKDFEIKYVFTSEELDERQRDSRVIQSLEAEIPFDVRRDLIDRYEIKYILADTQQAEMYLEIMNQNGPMLESVYQTKDFTLLQINSVDG
jgi:hypothetical protein